MLGELLQPVFEFAAYWTGKPVVRLLSLGRLHVRLDAEPDAQTKRKRWSSITFVRDGKRYVAADSVMLIGFLTWAAIGVMIWLVAMWIFN